MDEDLQVGTPTAVPWLQSHLCNQFQVAGYPSPEKGLLS